MPEFARTHPCTWHVFSDDLPTHPQSQLRFPLPLLWPPPSRTPIVYRNLIIARRLDVKFMRRPKGVTTKYPRSLDAAT